MVQPVGKGRDLGGRVRSGQWRDRHLKQKEWVKQCEQERVTGTEARARARGKPSEKCEQPGAVARTGRHGIAGGRLQARGLSLIHISEPTRQAS